jgi:hypothetical protein
MNVMFIPDKTPSTTRCLYTSKKKAVEAMQETVLPLKTFTTPKNSQKGKSERLKPAKAEERNFLWALAVMVTHNLDIVRLKTIIWSKKVRRFQI